MQTDRLELRLPAEPDRPRFIELFGNDAFMEFSAGVLDPISASDRFDRMLDRSSEFGFAKQCVIERSSAKIVGYSGIDWFEFEDVRRLEYGYRLEPEARGRGYATEAATVILDLADRTAAATTGCGEVYAIIDPRNEPSQNVARKLGFTFWKQAFVNGFVDNLYKRQLPATPPP